MAEEFQKPLSYIEASVFIFLVGYAIGQLIMGPIADQVGRRRTMIFGISIYTVSSIAIWFAASPETLLAMRLVQALGVSSTVGALPLVRDILGEARSRAAISWIMAGIVTAPLIAPLLGGLIEAHFGWRTLFAVLSALGILALIAVATLVPRDHHRNQIAGFRGAISDYRVVVGDRQTMLAILAAASAFGALFAFVTGSTAIYMVYFGQPSPSYGLLFAMNGVAMLAANALNANLVNYFGSHRLIQLGAIIMAVTGGGLIGSLLFSGGLITFVAFVMIFFLGFVLVETNSAIIALATFSERNGSVAAIMGSSQFGVGAAASGVVVFLGDGSPLAIVSVMVLCSVIVGVLVFLLTKTLREVSYDSAR